MDIRTESDALGTVNIPIDKLWGTSTQRCLENFPISTERMPAPLITAYIQVKMAVARTNQALGVLSDQKAEVIDKTCQLLLEEDYGDQFPLKIWQTGSGTQTNMNVNEVIAQLAKREFGIDLHPNDDVNKSQSTNDTFPTAIQISVVKEVENQLIPAIEEIIQTLDELEEHWTNVSKVGRTHLQDATPITLGQEVSGWRSMFCYSLESIQQAVTYVKQLPIGGTAVGTGLNTPEGYRDQVIVQLNKILDSDFTAQVNTFQGLSSKDYVLDLHSVINTLATNVLKIINDIRLYASGPRAGYHELIIPANEPGSSIMPGKINPTQIEALSMICAQIFGNQTTISFANSQGNFQLNAYMPVIAYNILQSIRLMADGLRSFNKRCLSGIEANHEQLTKHLNNSLMLVTALAPIIGYDRASTLAKQAYETGKTLKEVVLVDGVMSEEEFDEIVDPDKMV